MTRIRWSPQAVRDLEAILAYIAMDSPRYAALVVQRILDAVERLAAFPESGRVVPERDDPTVREIIVRPYRVVYRVKPGLAEVATVFRGSRILPDFDGGRPRE